MGGVISYTNGVKHRLLGVSEELLTDDTVDLILSGDEKLYFNGTSPTETREKADVLLNEVSAMLDDEDFTENDKTTFFSCIAEKYFAGKASTHLVGILGGCIWGLGTALSYIAAGKAGAAISYALGQGAPMIAALWGVFIWKEFTGSSKSTDRLLGIMFILFITGLSFIVLSGGN